MKSKVPTCQSSALLLLAVLMTIFSTQEISAQTQAPSVTTGVTFQWSDTQANNNDPATIESITINGDIYPSFAVPSAYELTRVGPDGHGPNKIHENGTIVNTNSWGADWAVDALAAFQDLNLNHYVASNPNGRDLCNDFSAPATTDSQLQTISYSPGIPSNDGGVLAITERNANNCIYLSVYGIPSGGTTEQYLGDTFVRPYSSNQNGNAFGAPPAGVDYWRSGRVVENGGTLGIALFLLDDLAPVGSVITRIEVLASTRDHYDGKILIMQKYATPKFETGCVNETFDGTVGNTFNIPAGSTFSLVSGPTPAGQAFTFNTDGTYSYTPTPGYLGDVVFDYEVCLPAPNTGICDTSTVTLTYVTYPNGNCVCISGNADGPMLQN